jgi:hypothetical protein
MIGQCGCRPSPIDESVNGCTSLPGSDRCVATKVEAPRTRRRCFGSHTISQSGGVTFASDAAKRLSRKRYVLRIRLRARSTRRHTCSRSATPVMRPAGGGVPFARKRGAMPGSGRRSGQLEGQLGGRGDELLADHGVNQSETRSVRRGGSNSNSLAGHWGEGLNSLFGASASAVNSPCFRASYCAWEHHRRHRAFGQSSTHRRRYCFPLRFDPAWHSTPGA